MREGVDENQDSIDMSPRGTEFRASLMGLTLEMLGDLVMNLHPSSDQILHHRPSKSHRVGISRQEPL